MKDIIYDHYIAIDWSNINMAIARMTKKSSKYPRPKDVALLLPPIGGLMNAYPRRR